MRENLTLNNLEVIIRGAMQIRKGMVKIMYEDKELSGHRRLVDIGLVNGDTLEVKANREKE